MSARCTGEASHEISRERHSLQIGLGANTTFGTVRLGANTAFG